MSLKLKAKRIRRLSKSQFAILFNCVNAKQLPDTRKLENEYINTSVQSKVLKINKKTYKKIKLFTIQQTKDLIKHFNIKEEELRQFT